nr:copia protein [Tanacetum cinerariifolium]
MADSTWIEAMQEELHQFDRLQVWELVEKPFGKMVIKLKWLWKNKKDEDQTVIRNKARLVAKGYAQEEADTIVLSQQELDLLFGPLYDKFFNATTSSVNKSSSPTDNSKHQDTSPTTNIQSSTQPINPTNTNAEENNDNQAEHEFTNPFCTPIQEVVESPLEQVRGNPIKPLHTRRQLAIDPEMCMFSFTMSTAEPKNIKEAMADSAWIEAM